MSNTPSAEELRQPLVDCAVDLSEENEKREHVGVGTGQPDRVDSSQPDSQSERKKKGCFSVSCLMGNFLVVLSQFINVANAELMQFQETNAHPYVHPYFSVWFNHLATGVWSAVFAAIWLAATKQTLMGVLRANRFPTFWGAFWVSAAFAAGLMFNIFWSISLPLVTVSVFMTISQTTCVFVLLFSTLFFKHRIVWLEIVSVVFCIFGVVVIAFLNGGGGGGGTPNSTAPNSSTAENGARWLDEVAAGAPDSNSLGGIACVVAFAVLQAGFIVVWGWRFESDPKVDKKASYAVLPVIIALVGLTNGLFLWPPLLTNAWLGWEPVLEFPTGQNLTLVLGGSCIASASNIVFMLAAVLASPLFLAVGTVLQIPLSIVSDLVLYDTAMTLVQLGGCALIVVGFVAQVCADFREKKRKADDAAESTRLRVLRGQQ